MISKSTWLKAAALSVMVLGTSAAGCGAEIAVEPAFYPPPSFIATTAPVYYEGRPAFWYNERWYFRTPTGWAYYRAEPKYLYEQRTIYGPPAHAYVRVRP